MKCPYQVILMVPTCVARDKPYVPNSGHRQVYCKRSEHVACPFFMTSTTVRSETLLKKMASLIVL
jgi:hypothetical protein